MGRFWILLKKDFLEAQRSYKLLWLPIVFILLGLTQPLTTYYLPEIIQFVGGLPEGMPFSLPDFTSQEVLAATLTDQFDQVGLLIIILAMMNIVLTDKNNGMLSFILTRQTAIHEYLLSKSVSQAIIIVFSVIVGYIAAIYYSVLLFGEITLSEVLLSISLYLVWCLFMMTFTLCCSAIFSKSAAAAGLSFIVLVVLKLFTMFQTNIQFLNPASLSTQASEVLLAGETLPSVYASVAAAIGFIIILLLIARQVLLKKELISM